MATTERTTGIIATPKTTVPLFGEKRWAYLARQRTIRVASTEVDGSIYLSPLWYVVDDKRIYLPIDAAGRHGVNGQSGRPLAALVDAGDEFATVSGVRILGRMVPVEDEAQIERIQSLLFDKYFGSGHPYAEAYFEMGEARARKFFELVAYKIVGWDAREIALSPAPESRVLPESVGDRLIR